MLVIVGGGRAEYKRYILERIARSYAIALLTPQQPTWERPYIVDHVTIDPADSQSVQAAITTLSDQYRITGVLTHQEPCISLVAQAAEALGLPGCGSDAARRCRDKYAARQAFEAAGVPSARYHVVHDTAEAVHAATEIGFPVVVKPRGLTASFGVCVVHDRAELTEAVDRALANTFAEGWQFEPGVLVEEYLPGTEISVDSVVLNGEARPIVYAGKVLGPPPFFDEFGHVVAPVSDLADEPERVLGVVRAAHHALGIQNSMTHTEIRLTPDGPRVVEVNGRLGGDLIPLVAQYAGGPDLATISAHVATGTGFDVPNEVTGVAGIRFFYPSDGEGSPDSEWVRQHVSLADGGAAAPAVAGRFYYSRTGFAIVEAASRAECLMRMTELANECSPVVS
ncbi:ATP-grasp domain-containing protein [Kibdelosporangium phytohabitans]|uniref:ATP-grasp domain-containing protein n=1 Tax=Kibdelosporangium phytohabitans TaxID=860235 RepID=UPI00146FCE84|nr:ATP-grasp domain-containing protein [Kibdelosporangium phytohabitans]MBE1465140.1 biotin carboxylase [Kibdelosporangium phytohabitans]